MDERLRRAIADRARGFCEGCGKPLGAEGVAHHRLLRSQGGKDHEANLVVLHDGCHRTLHANPLWARRHGLIVASWGDPITTPFVACRELPTAILTNCQHNVEDTP